MIKKMLTPPTNLSKEPYLTEWHADLEGGLEVWIQTSKDEENPKWMRLGDIYEKALYKHEAICLNEKSNSIEDCGCIDICCWSSPESYLNILK